MIIEIIHKTKNKPMPEDWLSECEDYLKTKKEISEKALNIIQ